MGTSVVTFERGRQRLVLGGLLVLYALAAVAFYLLPGGPPVVPPGSSTPLWQLALANAAIILIAYGLIGLLGLWLARRAGFPGIYRFGAGARDLLWTPLLIGAGAGVVLMVADLAAQRLGGYAGFPHPEFPASLPASLSAGIGEEIMFRLFVMSLWAALLGWVLRRVWPGGDTRRWSFWLANGIAALAFAASHLPAAMLLAGASTPAELPPLMLAELVVLNVFVALLAGRAFARDGLVAASGIHFWADVVWHVIFGGLV